MDDTCWFLDEMDNRENHSKLYKTQLFNLFRMEVELYGLSTYPDGGLRTSINDLSKYLLHISKYSKNTNTEILKKNTFTEMFKIDHVNHYTKFWEVQDHNIIGHGGADPGVKTGMYYNLKKRFGIIFFINTYPHGKSKNMIKKINEFAMQLNSTLD